METITTSFGAPWSTPQRTAAVLRAKAAASGVELAAVSEADLAAAVAGAHVWCATLKISLDSVRLAPAAARQAAAAILARAAGDASKRRVAPVSVPGRLVLGRTHRCQEAIEEAARWISSLGGVDVAAVLRAAAADLSAGLEDLELEHAVSLLLTSIDTQPAT